LRDANVMPAIRDANVGAGRHRLRRHAVISAGGGVRKRFLVGELFSPVQSGG
jgi:hypothetical protein